MAFPTYTTPTTTQFASVVTSMSVNLPASISSGDLLLAFVQTRYATSWTVPSGWNELASQVGGSSVGELTVFNRAADGTEGSTASWTAGTGNTAAWQVLKITGWDGTTTPEVGTASGDVSTANPPLLTASWGNPENLWLAVAGNAATSATTFTAAPSGYSGFLNVGASSGGAAVSLATSYENYLGVGVASEDPGTFTVSSNRFWAAMTVVIRPSAGGATTGQPRIKSAGTFTQKPLKVKLSGTFTEKPVKYKSGGTFSELV